MLNRLALLSTRLFPKNQGVEAYQISGIAARCDWVVLSDRKPPHAGLIGNAGESPRTVFLSLRDCFGALKYFHADVLPRITKPFVLISGSEDVTIPNQLDKRWRKFNAAERCIISGILDDERVVHWYAENLDSLHPKMSPLPVGCVTDPGVMSHRSDVIRVKPVSQRPLKALCAHRIRAGDQWDTRRLVSQLCRTHYQGCCDLLDEPIPEPEFIRLIGEYSFVVCAEGGGLDPSPKAWLSILYGAIPIMRSSALDSAYKRLPIIIVDDWGPATISSARLQRWLNELKHFYEHPIARWRVLYKLSLNYWWADILLAYYRGCGMNAALEGTGHDPVCSGHRSFRDVDAQWPVAPIRGQWGITRRSD